MPRSPRLAAVAAANRSASIRVDEGVDSPAEITAIRRASVSSGILPRGGHAEGAAGRRRGVLIGRAGGEVVSAVVGRTGLPGGSVAVDGLHPRRVGRGIRNI